MKKPNLISELEQRIQSLENALEQKTQAYNTLKAETEQKAGINRNTLSPDLKIYQLIVNSVSEAIYILNSKWQFVEINRGAELMYGYTRDELLGKTPLDVAAPGKNDLPAVQADLEHVLKYGGTRFFEFLGLRKNGNEFFKEVIINRGVLNNEQVIIATARDVTQRKMAEREILKFKGISDKAVQGNAIVDLKGNILYINDYFAKIHGYEKQELEAKNLSVFHTKEQLPRVDELNKRLYETGSYQSEEVWHVTKDGQEFPMLMNGVVIKDENNEPLYLAATAIDVTHIKKAEQKLHESQEKFRALYENAPMAYQSLDVDGNFLDINPTWLSILGYNREEVIGKNYADFLHPDWRNHFKKNFPKFKAKGSISDVQFKLRHKKGNYIDVSFEGCIGYHPDGSFKQTYCVFKDITAQNNAQQLLLDSEARFKGVYENANIGIALADKNANILEANGEFLQLLEYNDDEIKGMNFEKFTHPDDVKNELIFLKEILSNKRDNYRMEKRYVTKSGKTIWVDLAVTCQRNAGGQIDIFIGMVMDINQGKEFEAELIRARVRAEESDRLKSAFLANMSHEIRTPMNGILGFSELLDRPGLSEEERRHFLDIIKKSGERMLSTVNDIIEISKIESGQVAMVESTIDLNEEITNLYAFFKPEAEKKGLTLSFNNGGANHNLFVHIDQNKYNSVLTNLIKNAIKYTDEGSIELNVSFENNLLSYCVKDTGIGIPEDRQKAIFNRFEQADIGDSHAREGSGLGLSIASSYAEMLKGKIRFESELGVGSSFYFEVKLAPVENENSK